MNTINYQLTDDQSKRLNIMKLLLALFVVYIHNGMGEVKFANEIITTDLSGWFSYYSYALSEIIPRCAVSGFFFISSLLLYRKAFTWSANMKKRVKTLLIPYVIMNSFWIAAFALGQYIPQTQVFFNNQDNIVANFTWFRWLQAYGIGAQYPFLYPLWFVRNLLILNILAVVIKKIIDFAPKASFIIVCLIFLFLPSFPLNSFCYSLYVSDLCMWCFGYFVVKFKWDINKFDRNNAILISFIFLLIIRVALMNVDIPILSTLISRVSLLINLMFWYSWFSKNINGKIQKLFLKLSGYNFGIYLFHEMNLTFAKKLIAKILGTSLIVQFFQCMLLPSIIVMLVVILCIVLKKVFPRFFSVLTGSRV